MAFGIGLLTVGLSVLSSVLAYSIIFGFPYALLSPLVPWASFAFIGGSTLIAVAWANC
jgi:hypothetical protein